MKNLYKVHKINLRNVLRTMAFKKVGVTALVFFSKTHLEIAKNTWAHIEGFPEEIP